MSGGGNTFRFEAGERQQIAGMLQRYGEVLRHMNIAIDGPAGSGKSTTARRLAARLHLQHLDTGAMYRALTLVALRCDADCTDGGMLARLLDEVPIRFVNQAPVTPAYAEDAADSSARVFLGDEDITSAIRTPQVTQAVSAVSALPAVRRQMVLRQRRISEQGGTVMEGRDIGTVVLPHADVKVYLVADAHVRAVRRQREEWQGGSPRHIEQIEQELVQRDHADATRSSAPMRPAGDAIHLDTSAIDLEEQVDAVIAMTLRALHAAPQDPRFRRPGGARETRLTDWQQEGWQRYRSPFYHFAQQSIRHALQAWFGVRYFGPFDQPMTGSVLVACNHVSALDPPLVGSALPFQLSFIAKEELFRIPILGSTIRSLQAIPIRRGTADYEALDRAIELLRQGTSIMMFPEGTRHPPGNLGAPRWGFGYVAKRAGRPILPVFLRGGRSRKPRFFRPHPLEVWLGEAVDVAEITGRDDRDTYRRIGREAMRRIEGLMLRSAGRRPLEGLTLATQDSAARMLDAGALPSAGPPEN